MGTEQPDIERMHRLFDDALDGVDLTGSVVPGVLTGYDRKVRLRRYQGAGVALAVLAAAGVAVGTLPRGGAGNVSAASATSNQGPGYCSHQNWLNVRGATLIPDPTPYQANCEALQTALHTVVPAAYVVPDFNADLTLDPRVDQALLKKVNAENDPVKRYADTAKYFGSELKYLAIHPEDPANVYMPDRYELVTSTSREEIGVGLGVPTKEVPAEAFPGTDDSYDCAKMPAILKGKVQCTPVAVASRWHGALWNIPARGVDDATQMVVLTDGHGKTLTLGGSGNDHQAWYHEGLYDKSFGWSLPGDTWIDRWTGQTHEGSAPPALQAWTDQQWAQFVASPELQKYADGYLDYAAKTKPKPDPRPSNSH